MGRGALCYYTHMSFCKSVEIAVSIEHNRGWGRTVCEGIAAFAQAHPEWHLTMMPQYVRRASSLERFDGFIWCISDEHTAQILRATGKPVVDLFAQDFASDMVSIGTDHAACGRLAAQTFISQHFANFAYLGWKGLTFSDRKQKPYVEELRREGRKCHIYLSRAMTMPGYLDRHVRNEQLAIPSDARAIGRWVSRLPKPVAVFCANDFRAWQLAEICRLNEIRIPGDVAILGADNDPVPCLFTSIPISSIEPGALATGFRAAELIDGMLGGHEPECRRIRLAPAGVVRRGSTAVYPVDPPWLADVLQHIRADVSESLTAEDIAAFVGKSYSMVEKVFKRVLGTTVQREIMSARLDVAEYLLKATALPVADVAVRSGFKSPQYFNRSFAARHGVSPGEWRMKRLR